MLDPAIESRDPALLDPDFAAKLVQLLAACEARGAKFVVDATVRGPARQAQLWCQSRTLAEIAAARDKLTAFGAPKLASLLLEPASPGPCVTHALPGESWHEFALGIESLHLQQSGDLGLVGTLGCILAIAGLLRD